MRLPPTPRAPRLSRSGLIVLLYGGLGLAAALWGALAGHPDILRVPDRAEPPRTLEGIALGVGFALLMVFLSRWAKHRFQWARVLHLEFRDLLGALTATEILLLASTSSIGEECFFRGAMLPDLGLWLSSALFALPHVGPSTKLTKFLPWTATSFLVGLALGALFRFSGDLAGPISAHFLINLINLHRITREPA